MFRKILENGHLQVMTGDIPRSLTLKDLRTAFPDVWSEQEERWFGGDMASWGEG